MSKLVALLAAVVLVLAAIRAQDAAPPRKVDDATAKIVLANERALYDAVATSDKAAFQSLVLPDGVWTTASGFVPMALLADRLGQFQLPKWGIENPRITWSGDNSALLLYVRTGGGTFNDEPLAAISLASTLWTKRDGKWRAVHHQETDLTRQ